MHDLPNLTTTLFVRCKHTLSGLTPHQGQHLPTTSAQCLRVRQTYTLGRQACTHNTRQTHTRLTNQAPPQNTHTHKQLNQPHLCAVWWSKLLPSCAVPQCDGDGALEHTHTATREAHTTSSQLTKGGGKAAALFCVFGGGEGEVRGCGGEVLRRRVITVMMVVVVVTSKANEHGRRSHSHLQ